MCDPICSNQCGDEKKKKKHQKMKEGRGRTKLMGSDSNAEDFETEPSRQHQNI